MFAPALLSPAPAAAAPAAGPGGVVATAEDDHDAEDAAAATAQQPLRQGQSQGGQDDAGQDQVRQGAVRRAAGARPGRTSCQGILDWLSIAVNMVLGLRGINERSNLRATLGNDPIFWRFKKGLYVSSRSYRVYVRLHVMWANLGDNYYTLGYDILIRFFSRVRYASREMK